MSQQIPEAGAVELTSTPYKDRSTGLMVFGILTIILGAIAGMSAAFMLLGQMAVPKTGGAAMPISAIVPAVLMYLFIATALIWSGIGSIVARRWARALILIFSWGWLLMGICGIGGAAYMMPKIMAEGAGTNQDLPGAEVVVMTVAIGTLAVFFIIMPIIWIVFYQSRHVRATCETRDATMRWTDACPLPVLALSLWLMFSVLIFLEMPLTGHAIFPFFGTFLTGAAGALWSLIMAAIWTCAAWLLYKLDARGWWLILIALLAYGISSFITFSRHDFNEIYQLMGYPPAQLEQMQKFGFSGKPAAWISSVFMVPFVVYILFIKKYLRGTSSS